ncbi:peptidylprolyl isomerase [Rheinheimera sp. MMS21-TC3]|uniref:peptidylprolyl isomerase n=1 Tax=Rheinheimera sp. MMS21-TC3 TaxID=3072790 RepID=UPI0028C45627|nr:peptidylprolyl isomerase [Rheinheimera sp. MMS21-TC3]WNO59623.1 peptidylprolyl isomerase [Rheinheimera sp. MMS21-TC3]
MNKTFMAVSAAALLLACTAVQATIVEVKTNLGNFEINLFDQSTPITVQNFLKYTNAEGFNNTVIHRSVPGFVIQGGGFTFDQTTLLKPTEVYSPIKNEPKWSNVRGTIAMAKLAGNPHSATNQWFINLSNNAANLDNQNGGFTVFGQINAQGMEVIDAMAALPRFKFPTLNIADLPLQNYSAADQASNKAVIASNFIVIESITVVDASPSTEVNVTKIPTTATDTSNPGAVVSSGSAGLISLLGLMFVAVRRRVISK